MERNVGIGTTAPTATLHVTGEVKIGNTGLACDASNESAMRYNSTTHQAEYCNGISWTSLQGPQGPTGPQGPAGVSGAACGAHVHLTVWASSVYAYLNCDAHIYFYQCVNGTTVQFLDLSGPSCPSGG